MKIISEKNNLAEKAGKCLENLLEKNSNKAVLLMLSGGSALSLLDHVSENVLSKNLTISVLDEKFDTDPEVNNFSQITQTDFYKKAEAGGVSFIDTRPKENESLEDLESHFEEELRRWEANNLDGVVIATMGIGPDGHTSGIMPYPESKVTYEDLFENKQKWVAGYDANEKNKYPLRATTTNTFLRYVVNNAIVFVSGKEKKAVLEKVLAESGELYQTPARIIKEMKDVTLFTDIELE